MVGYADFAIIQQQEAELGFAIGESAQWGAGLGAATALAMITYGLEHLGLSQIRAYMGELTTVVEFALHR